MNLINNLEIELFATTLFFFNYRNIGINAIKNIACEYKVRLYVFEIILTL